jgi:myo-inositol-1(or 4)-monophosphatase
VKQYKEICEKAIEVIQKTGDFILHESSKFSLTDVETKSRNSFVSYVDKNAEERLVAGLKAILPESGFLTEEETISERGKEFEWIIDPLDGTTNFIHKVPLFAISVALLQNNKPVIGIVLELTRNECFYSWEGGKVYLNGDEIRVSKAQTIEDSLVATGFPYYDFRILKQYMDIIEELAIKSQGIRRFGSAATDLAYVAAGRFDIFFEHSLNSWDVAAGAFLVQQAGGKVTDFSGGSNYLFGKEIIATTPAVYKELQTLIHSKLIVE